MKKYISTLLFLIMSFTAVTAQKTDGYVTLEDCNNNKLDYLIANFEDQKGKYIGKPMSILINDLELYVYNQVYKHQRKVSKTEFQGLTLYFYNHGDYFNLTNEEFHKKLDDGEITFMSITSEELIKFSDYLPLLRKHGSQGWSEEIKQFYGNYTIKSLEVSGHTSRGK